MNQELWMGAALFVVASSITPGPNNTMLMASGVRFGFRRTFAHLMGVQLGFGFMLLSVGMGLHTVLAQFEGFYDVVRVAGAAYMVWIAWKLASAKAHQDDLQHAEQPMGFWAAVAFQWSTQGLGDGGELYEHLSAAAGRAGPDCAAGALVCRAGLALFGQLGWFWQRHARLFARP